jgi:hypothetical protein
MSRAATVSVQKTVGWFVNGSACGAFARNIHDIPWLNVMVGYLRRDRFDLIHGRAVYKYSLIGVLRSPAMGIVAFRSTRRRWGKKARTPASTLTRPVAATRPPLVPGRVPRYPPKEYIFGCAMHASVQASGLGHG